MVFKMYNASVRRIKPTYEYVRMFQNNSYKQCWTFKTVHKKLVLSYLVTPAIRFTKYGRRYLMKNTPKCVPCKICSQQNFIWLGNFWTLRLTSKDGNSFWSKTSPIIDLALDFKMKVACIFVFVVERFFQVKMIRIITSIRHVKTLFP